MGNVNRDSWKEITTQHTQHAGERAKRHLRRTPTVLALPYNRDSPGPGQSKSQKGGRAVTSLCLGCKWPRLGTQIAASREPSLCHFSDSRDRFTLPRRSHVSLSLQTPRAPLTAKSSHLPSLRPQQWLSKESDRQMLIFYNKLSCTSIFSSLTVKFYVHFNLYNSVI